MLSDVAVAGQSDTDIACRLNAPGPALTRLALFVETGQDFCARLQNRSGLVARMASDENICNSYLDEGHKPPPLAGDALGAGSSSE